MKPRQLTMMGLGSAIGAGLFLGSGAGIQAAGPAVLISYLVAGTLIILVMWALGEMAAANPNSGAFSVYAQKAMGKTAGATVGWLWWLQLVVVIAAEALGAAALLFTVWPVIPVWALSLIFMALFTAINLAGVKNFGEFEFWFAILKVGAILLFLGIGAALLLGLLPDVPSPGLQQLHHRLRPRGAGRHCHRPVRRDLRLRRHRDRQRRRRRDREPCSTASPRRSARWSGGFWCSTSAPSSSSPPSCPPRPRP